MDLRLEVSPSDFCLRVPSVKENMFVWKSHTVWIASHVRATRRESKKSGCLAVVSHTGLNSICQGYLGDISEGFMCWKELM
jgi:hypothetical protein